MKVLIADKFEESGIRSLQEAGCDVTLDPQLADEALAEALRVTSSDVLVVRSTKVGAEALASSPNLKLVIRAGSGYDTIAVDTASVLGVRVANCPGKNSVAVAELTLGLMIALDRRIVDETDDLRHGIWNKKEYSKARGLKGRTLGIVGLGRIGYEVAKRARAFEMELLYTDVVANAAVEQELGLARVELDELLERSDFVALHVPGGSETKHLISAGELAKMKPTACLLNCSRGGIVDERALAVALTEGRLRGAALDVYEIEPAATSHKFEDPIPSAPHVYGTHHVGASTDQAQEAVAEEVVKIIKRFREDGTVLHCVNQPEPTKAA